MNSINLTHQDWKSGLTVLYPIDESQTLVRSVEEFESAISDESIKEITLVGEIGNANMYNIYNLNRSVTIKGTQGSKVFGTFMIKSKNVKIENLSIQNEGDLGGNQTKGPEPRANILVYAENVTLRNNVLTNALDDQKGLANAIQIFSNVDENPLSNYAIEGNTITGFNQSARGSSSTAIIIAQGYKSTIIGKKYAKTIKATQVDYDNLLSNHLSKNSIDLTHQDWEGGLEVLFQSNN